MQTWAILAAKHAALTSGIGLGAIPALGGIRWTASPSACCSPASASRVRRGAAGAELPAPARRQRVRG